MGKARKTNGLLFKFAIIFIIFTLVTLTFSGIATYYNQNELYKQQCEENLKNIANYLSNLIVMDGEDFLHYQKFCLEHGKEMEIPLDFTSNDEARFKFEQMFAERYPGKVLGENIRFDELDYDLQLAYATYQHEYYLLEFEKAAGQFHIAYAYYIVPQPELGEDYVMYLLDCVREKREDGSGYIDVCLSYPQVIERHALLWEAWNTGKSPHGYDSFDNDYGKTYAYYTPLIIHGEKLGVIVTEVDIDAVNTAILNNSLIQSLTIGIILVLCILAMLIIINRNYISKIANLELGVREYTTNKNPSIAEKVEANAAGKHEIASLSRQTAEMIRELDSYILHVRTMTAEKERIETELSVAAKMQSDMLPKKFPARDDFKLFATMTPAREMGGDFYDFFSIDKNHIGLVMADVSGKGVPAAMFMIVARTLLKIRTTSLGKPSRMIADVNNTLCADNPSGLFVTVWFGVLTLSSGELTYVNAGHEYPALMHQDGNYELIQSQNMPPLGAMEDLVYTDTVITLGKGDKLFLYTDGIPEAKNPDGKRFGTDQMLTVLNQNKDVSPEELLKNMKSEVDRFTGENDSFDDVTMMSFVWNGSH